MTKSLRTLAIAALLALPVVACAGEDDSEAVARCCPPVSDPEQSSAAQLQACDPLNGAEQPVTLGKVLAVGRDDADVMYVLVDPGTGEYQVFVSEDGALQRHRVLGSGSGDELWVTVTVEADPQFGLYVNLDANGAAESMRRFDPAAVTDKGQEPDGDDLDVLDASAIDDLDLRNLPADITIEYLGMIEDGRRVLVVRPTDDWSYEDFRVFLGTPQQMIERDVQNVTRAKDGGSTRIELTLDDTPAELDFPVVYTGGDTFEHGPSTLTSASETLSIALQDQPDSSAVDGLNFRCR
jgi:hypothetical protein